VRPFATFLAFLAAAGVFTPAYAQMVDGPPGTTGGLFGGRRAVNPNRTSQSLDMNIDLSGGYDHDPNVYPDPSLTRDPGWTVGEGLITSNYRVGHTRRSLDVRGRGTVNYQGNTNTPLYGGGATVNGIARFGKQQLNQLLLNFEAAYDPGSVFGYIFPGFPQEGAVEPLDIVPVIGVIEQRWLSTSATSNYQHHWNERHQSDVLVGTGRMSPSSDDTGLDSEWQNAMFTQAWTINSGLDFTGSYRFDRSVQQNLSRLEGVAAELPIKYQTATGGVRFNRRLSSIRRMSVALSGGATQLLLSDAGEAAGVDEFHPTFSASFEYILARQWSFNLTANRAITVLAGISSQPVTSDTVALGLHGTVGRRFRLSVNSSYMKGSTIAREAATATTGVGGDISVRYGLRNWLGTFATYSYYHHTLQNAFQAAVSGLPPLYDRHTVRGGITLWLPLYGAF
jgi:hypothetical protein